MGCAPRCRCGAVVALLIGVVAGAGCVWKGGSVGADAADQPVSGVWFARPVSLRVYPSTDFSEGADGAMLVARIELADAMGDSVKGSGKFRLVLLGHEHDGDSSIGTPLYSWRVPILSRADQYEHYDSVTRTYLFKLKMDRAYRGAQPPVLRVTFTSARGDRLEVEDTVPPQHVSGGAEP